MTALEQAQRLLREGRVEEAERAYEALLKQHPDNVEGLNVLALRALRNANHQAALELLLRAAQLQPRHAMTQYHLGLARQQLDDWHSAATAFAQAVDINGNFFLARLHLGVALERLHRPEQASLQYERALKDAQRLGYWLNRDSTAHELRPLVEHAVMMIRRDRRNLLFALLDPLRRHHGQGELRRLERCLRIYLNEEAAPVVDQRQQPTFLFFPELPATPYFDRGLFQWIEELEASTARIRTELLQLLPSSAGRERVFDNASIEQQNLRGDITPPSWNGYYFYRHGKRRVDNCSACPATAEALESIPLARVREHAPEAFFSVFTAGTHLLPHRGVTNTRVVAHLPLIVPDDCALSVGGEIHRWQEGRVVVFDDTYEHEAWNRSDQTRVVLIFDLWNPWLTEIERDALAEIVAAIGDSRKAVETI